MLFNSIPFLLFFPAVTIIYFILPGRSRWLWLLAASYFFYLNWNPAFAISLVSSTLITYFGGRLIQTGKTIHQRKFWLTTSIILNLSMLIIYKYNDFLGETIAYIMNFAGVAVNFPEFGLLLPVGISFYTFQTLSYIIDVYRRKVNAERNPGIYALFVSFFPQIASGPISRAPLLIPQLREFHPFDDSRIKSGLMLMLWGYFKKLVIADRLAVLVSTVFDYPAEHHGIEIIVAVVFFAIQIYCDFSGYTDIAIGAARIMGFNLAKNFDMPYFASSVTEFWHRWHISLSSWFRDYVYFPLGGNRNGKIRTYLNLFTVFVISGLWHGAAATFIIWGALHGLFIIIEKAFKSLSGKFVDRLRMNTELTAVKFSRILVTFCLVSFAWIFFRANSFNDSVMLVENAFRWDWNIIFSGGLYKLGLDYRDFQLAVISILVLILIEFFEMTNGISTRFFMQHRVVRWVFYLIAVLVILIFGYYGGEEKEFIYLQF